MKIDQKTIEEIKKWMDSMFVPSSNAENVITKKINGEKVISVKHWRTDKLKNLFEVC